LIAGLFSLPLASADMPPAAPRANSATPTRSAVGNALSGVPSTPTRSVSEGPTSSDHFIAGPENALVRTLADAATTDPLTFNPLVLCGPIGVGKTCLAHALAARRRERLGLARVIATTGSDLVRSLAHAIETDAVADFRAAHHECDVLLIDDVHQLAGKPAAQQFLLAALNSLLQRGSLVIATLRHLPQATDGLPAALLSRLASGLVVSLAPPGVLARRELVRQAASRVKLPVHECIVNRLAGEDGPRAHFVMPSQLRHAVLQLALSDSPDTVAAPAQVCAKQVCKHAATAVARHSGLTLTEIRGKSRRQVVADARGLAMYLARHISRASYAEIGRHFGHRDHTTVLHACNKFTDRIAQDDATRRLAADLQAQITADCQP
jgi:chromosomal replication initiator protein